MNLRNESFEILILGTVLIVAGVIGVNKAKIAYMQHALIPFKGSSMSPLQAGIASVLCLAFGLFGLALWCQRRKK